MRLPRFARRGASFSKLAYARQEKLSQDRGVGKRLVVIATMATAMTTTAMAATPMTAAVSATMTTAVEAAAMTTAVTATMEAAAMAAAPAMPAKTAAPAQTMAPGIAAPIPAGAIPGRVVPAIMAISPEELDQLRLELCAGIIDRIAMIDGIAKALRHRFTRRS